ncbi:PH domain-containing protein [Ornithinimicrobium faecis]|uniref:PH domain-containing protein n=1 Tax=Ornithinimicrobium faecis TaxID=2934158 RepID=UPI002117A74E|nr:PH domain-containing protein [Ornithinimicrobium sp. HY1745]
MSPKDPYAVFRPRRGALVAWGSALAVLVAFGVLAILAPGGWNMADRIVVGIFAVVVAAGLARFAIVRAVPTSEGLHVINLVRSRRLEWAEILRVNALDGGHPWVILELADTEELSVMGIQRADGQFAHAEAARLAALVQHHSS